MSVCMMQRCQTCYLMQHQQNVRNAHGTPLCQHKCEPLESSSCLLATVHGKHTQLLCSATATNQHHAHLFYASWGLLVHYRGGVSSL